MILYKCDTCGMEMTADTRADAWSTPPEGWIQTRLVISGSRRMKVHFCSFDCVSGFKKEEYFRRATAGLLSIKRRSISK